MVEILGDNLKQFFSKIDEYEIESRITYKGKMYEVWEVDDDLFQEMCDMPDEKFEELAGEESWWRSSNGSVLGTPDTKIYINGNELIGWAGEPWEDEDEDDEFVIYASTLSNYLCDVMRVSSPRNVVAVAVDLAKYNGITMGELFSKYEG